MKARLILLVCMLFLVVGCDNLIECCNAEYNSNNERLRLSGRISDLDFYIVEPMEYAIYESNSVLFNITANFTTSTINVNLYTRTNNNTFPYVLTVNDLVLVNGSYISTTITFEDHDRVWWYWEFVDNQNKLIGNTPRGIFDIDADYYCNC